MYLSSKQQLKYLYYSLLYSLDTLDITTFSVMDKLEG